MCGDTFILRRTARIKQSYARRGRDAYRDLHSTTTETCRSDRSDIPAPALGECAMRCLTADLRRGEKTLLFRVPQNLLWGAEALHPGFPPPLLCACVFFIPLLSAGPGAGSLAPRCSAACGTSPIACPDLGRERATAQPASAGRCLGASGRSSGRQKPQQRRSRVSVVGKIIVGFCPHSPLLYSFKVLRRKGMRRRDFQFTACV